MNTVTVQPSSFRPEVIDSIRMVGRTVTWRDRQYRVYSVEGPDFYAFGSKIVGDKSITIDFDMDLAYRPGVHAYIIPTGCEFGEGYGQEVPIEWIKAGVCLAKREASV